MNIINPSVYLVDEPNIFKKVELIGRTCYKSEDKITSDSSMKFIDGLVKRQHFAMLEHGVVHFVLNGEFDDSELLKLFPMYSVFDRLPNTYESDDILVTLSLTHIYKELTKPVDNSIGQIIYTHLYSTLVSRYNNEENTDESKNNSIKFQLFNHSEEVEITLLSDDELIEMFEGNSDLLSRHLYFTFKFVCDRGVSHELVRHRCSVAQESTRYCNYSKSKFGGEVCFILPSTFNSWKPSAQNRFILACMESERNYLDAIEEGLTPQQARSMLINSLKTEVVLTMPTWQWQHFFNLRSVGTTGLPHPDMKQVADVAYGMFQKRLMDKHIILS